MPVLPVCLSEPLGIQFAALLPQRPPIAPRHPLGCHRQRVPDRVMFKHVLAALVHGSGYECISSPGCSDRTIRRRLQEWAELGVAEQVHTLVLQAYDRMIGLDLEGLAVAGCITKAPAGGATAGRSPEDRGKQGLKRSVVTDQTGIPLHLVSASANRHDSPLLAPILTGLDKLDGLLLGTTVHLDRAYDNQPTRALWAALGLDGAIAARACPPRCRPAPAGSWNAPMPG